MKNRFRKLLIVVIGYFIVLGCMNIQSNVGSMRVFSQEDNHRQVNLMNLEGTVEEMFDNQAFERAWSDYLELISQVIFSNSYQVDSQGTTQKKFDQLGILDTDFQEIQYRKDAILRVYKYETGQAFNEEVGSDPGRAYLQVLFVDNHLRYLGLSNGSFIFDEQNLLNQAKVEALSQKAFDYKELGIDSPIVINVGTSLVNNQQHSLISMLSGPIDQPIVEYFIVKDNKFDYINSHLLADIGDKDFELTQQALVDFISLDANKFYKLTTPNNN